MQDCIESVQVSSSERENMHKCTEMTANNKSQCVFSKYLKQYLILEFDSFSQTKKRMTNANCHTETRMAKVNILDAHNFSFLMEGLN